MARPRCCNCCPPDPFVSTSFTPTLDQVYEAARSLPNPYAMTNHSGRYRTHVREPMPACFPLCGCSIANNVCHVLDFEIVREFDAARRPFYRWKFKGDVLV